MSIVREDFFAFFEDTGSQGDGFALFGGTHLTVLAVLAVISAFMCILYDNSSDSGRSAIARATALAIFALEAAKQATFFLLHRHYWINQLTLHLCGLCIFAELIHAFFPHKTTGGILYSLGLPGAFAALLFPNWTMYPIMNFYCLQSFIIHALQITFVLMPLISGELRPDRGRIWRVIVFLLIVVPPVYMINLRLGTNFFFVNAGSEGSPLEILIKLFGNPGFLLPYIGLVAAVWFFMYLPWELSKRRVRGGGIAILHKRYCQLLL